MKEICIEFAEWVGTNTFDPRFGGMVHYINSRGFHMWSLDHSEIFTNNLYQKFCDIKGIEFTISQKILYWDGKFEPTRFMEYIGKKGYCYYRYSYKGVPQKPYWTKSGKDMGKEKFNTDELWDDFNNVLVKL